MSSQGFDGQDIEEESSWRYPLGIFFTTLILCAVFLYYYVGPGVEEIAGETPKPTISDEAIDLTVGDRQFSVPANYTIYPKDRRSGKRDNLSLYAFWPTMNGYAPARRDDFTLHAPDSRRIDILIEERGSHFSEDQRMEMLYLPHVVDKRGTSFDYGLSKFVFKELSENAPTNGYSNKDLFVGATDDQDLVVIFCYKPTETEVVPQECWREFDLSPLLTVKYIYKRPYLPEWRTIDEKVREFVADIMQEPIR